MSSKGEIVRKLSLRRCTLAIIILCASAQWASGDVLAPEAAAASLKMTERSTFSLLKGPGSSTIPDLVTGIAVRGNTASYGSLRLARDESANPSAKNDISRTVGSVTFFNRAEKGASGPLVLSSLFESTAGARGFTDSHAKSTIRRQTTQSSRDHQRGANVYSLLDDGLALGPSRYGHRMQYFLSKQWLADSESFTQERSSAVRIKSDAISTTNRQAAVIILLISASQFPHRD